MSLLVVGAALLVAFFRGVQFVTTKVGVAAIPPPLFGALRPPRLFPPASLRLRQRPYWKAAVLPRKLLAQC